MSLSSLSVGLVGLLSLLLTACAGFTPQPGPGLEPEGRYVVLTAPVTMLGDTQEHVSTGYPMHDNDSAVDAYVEVAQRPPEQTLFGRRLMEWALLEMPPGEPFLHLGDVMDLSCRVEAERMAHIFRAVGHSGAIVPGNHDGLFFGIFAFNVLAPELDSDAERWRHACRRGAAPDDERHRSDNEAISKRDFIALYIREHTSSTPAKPGLNSPPEAGPYEVSWRSPDPDAFLSGVKARLRGGIDYANSFIAQRLKLPRAPGATHNVIVIGLDTNQAGPLVSAWDAVTGKSPGSAGHVHPDQMEAIREWVDEAAKNDDIVVFAGHHNWRSLGLPTRTLLRLLMGKLEHPLVYLSAHTHRGFWAVHDAPLQRSVLEMNVSSLSDWPLAYRRLSFAYDESAQRLKVRAELMPSREGEAHNDAELLAAWEEQACGPSGVPLEHLKREDLKLVERQRASRGTLVSWLVESLAPVCSTCENVLYEHAQRYQDELLEALVEVAQDLGAEEHLLHAIELPSWCGETDFTICARGLMQEQVDSFQANVELFRRKAALVSLLNDHLDDLSSHRARAYMTCRAVLAAKLDFDLTPDDANANRGEAKRKLEQFFRTEASIGM